MGDKSKIEWTDATWNPTVGCTRVSPGCDHCYAFQLHDQRHVAWKRGRMPDAPAQYHQPFSRMQLLAQRLDQPLRWQRPRRIFVNSLSDLFHEAIPAEFVDRVFAVMVLAPQHTFQVLTKRPARMRKYMSDPELYARVLRAAREFREQRPSLTGVPIGPPPWRNIWLGTTAEDQPRLDERIWHLLMTPARVRFLSLEPLLGPLDLWPVPMAHVRCGVHGNYAPEPDSPCEPCRCWPDRSAIDWVIVGGESGPHARPMHPEWARTLRDDCTKVGVPFLFKQWGEWLPVADFRQLPGMPREAPLAAVPFDGNYPKGSRPGDMSLDGDPTPLDARMVGMARVGKKRAGRLLDGRTWDEFPDARVPSS